MEAAELSVRGKHSLEALQTMRSRGIGFIDATAETCVKMSSAENNLCDDLLLKRFQQADMQQVTAEMFHYFDYRGTERFRSAISSFMTTKFRSQTCVDPENIVVAAGACTLFDLLAHSLAESGDHFMCFAPCYYGTPPDLNSRAQVRSWMVQLPTLDKSSKCALNITKSLLETELERAENQGVCIKGIVFVNPHNPTGKVFSAQTLQEVLDFADRHNLHAIVDEIYALSVHDPKAEFKSVLSLLRIPRPEMTHQIWGFSKHAFQDMGMAGLRCGVLHTWNKQLIESLRYILYMCAVPVMIQDKLTCLLSDTDWMELFLTESKKRLRESYLHCLKRLQPLDVPVCPAQAGVFLWINLRKFLRSAEDEAELELNAEFERRGVKLTPGAGFYCEEPGWFRVTFAKPKETLDLGLDRILSVLSSTG